MSLPGRIIGRTARCSVRHDCTRLRRTPRAGRAHHTGKGSPTLARRAEQVEYYRTHNTRLRDRAMIESIFTRDKAGTTDPAVPKALADAELVFGETVPTGT